MTGTYNLLDEPWLPVRSQSGTRRWIRPAEVATRQDPALYIDSGRPDFDGALTQFLIGLLQTCAAPPDQGSWRKWMREPPAVEQLDELFAPVRHAFFLDGDGPRFMQDLELEEDGGEGVSVAALLIESPGGKTVRDNGDLFIKRDLVTAMGAPAVAAALFTLQTNAPAGGVGHRTSLRGGGPLSTLPLGESLWKTCWLSVLTNPDLAGVPGNIGLDAIDAKFPWMAETRTSEGNKGVVPEDAHPTQHYWAMPRRIRLRLEKREDVCGVYGVPADLLCGAYVTKNYGCKYDGAWLHPLTPHTRMKDGEPPNPRKGQPSGISYRDWPLLVSEGADHWPALTVRVYLDHDRYEYADTDRLWVFGYDMDNMKARCWHSATTPILVSGLNADDRAAVARFAQQLVAVSESVRLTLGRQVRAALSRRPKDLKGDLSVLARSFWQATEPAFFSCLKPYAANPSSQELRGRAAERWLAALHEAALQIFDLHSQSTAVFDCLDVKRVALARLDLVKFTSPRGKKLRGLVELGPPKKEPKREAHQQEAVADV